MLVALLALGLPAPVATASEGADAIASAPLLERAAEPGRLFERMDPAAVGVDFVHQTNPEPKYRNLLNQQLPSNALVGGGVAIGDYDGSGLPDIFLTRPSGGNRLYRNRGNFEFEDVTEAAGIVDDSWGGGAAFADINGSGHLDLFVCGYDTPCRLWINQGDGTFVEGAEAAGLDFKGAPVMMSLIDYNGNGHLDIYLATNHYAISYARGDHGESGEGPGTGSGDAVVRLADEATEGELQLAFDERGMEVYGQRAQKDILFRNNGDGTFTDVSEEAGIYGRNYALSATWWDSNGNGLPDLYVANDFYGTDRLYLNQGNGTFENVINQALPNIPWFSMGSAAGDLDNDGRLDFVATDMAFTSHYKQKIGMGEMGDATLFLQISRPPQYMRNAVFRNSGTPRFQEVAHLAGLAATDWTWAVKLADFDATGWMDAYFTNGMIRDFINSDLLAESLKHPDPGAFWAEQPQLREPNHAFRNHGDWRFEKIAAEWGLDHYGVSFGAAVADLDGSGYLDLVVNNFEEPVGIYRNRATGNHRVVVRLRGTESNTFGYGATVRIETADGKQVRYLAPQTGYMGSDEPIVHFGLGTVDAIDLLTVEWPSGRVQEFGDLAVNRVYTIREPAGVAPERDEPEPPETMFSRGVGPRLAETPFDDFQQQPLLPFKLSQMGPAVAVGDIDGDGRDDFFLGGPAGEHGLLFRTGATDGGPGIDTPETIAADSDYYDMGVLFFDANANGLKDLYVVSGSVRVELGNALLRDRLYWNRGDGRFERAEDGVLPDLRDSGSVVTAADFNRNGLLDLFVGSRSVPGDYPAIPESRLLRNEGGRFVEVTDSVAPGLREAGMVTTAVWADTDNSGWQDLIVAYEWGPIRVWRNENGGLVDRTEEAGLAGLSGWWTGLAVGDVNNNGHLDIVAGNLGLNSKYKASPEKPMMLYYADYTGTGERQVIEAKWEGDTIYPVRGLGCSSDAMPILRERFPTFHEFASSTLVDIYTPEVLEDAERREMTELRSGVFLNDGAGRFEFVPLPRLAQVAPVYGVTLADITGNGNLDLVLGQNFYSPEPETGWLAGGVSQLLLGRGDGTFDLVEADESGIVVSGDAMGLAAADLNDNGWLDLVFGVNDDHLQMYLNRGIESNAVQPIRLRYRAGNPDAVGARVDAVLSDGTARSAQVHAGQSYMSQSTSLISFGLGPEAYIEQLNVRWPDGSESTYELAPEIRGEPVTLDHGAGMTLRSR